MFSHLSLKTKMIVSYLIVIVGTVIVLSIAITIAAQNYIYNQQMMYLQREADVNVKQLKYLYVYSGYTWDALRTDRPGPELGLGRDPSGIFYLADSSGVVKTCVDVLVREANNCASAAGTLTNITKLTLRTLQEQQGTIDLVIGHETVGSYYISRPIQLTSPNDGSARTIGCFILTVPIASLTGLLHQATQSIILAGAGVALVAMVVGYLLVSRFIRPLEDLIKAVEQVKHGQYARRVSPPTSQDELGQLAQTFNEMADKIESDVNELRRQDQLRRDLVANIAHDLATPLTAIQGFSEALADEVITDSTARHETAQRIGREVQRLRRMVAEVRQMSSLEAGQAKLDLAPLDMHSLVDETLAVIASECEQKGILLYNDIDSTVPAVQADSDRITQGLLNLLDNARRHTPEEGDLRVGAQVHGGHLVVWVQDSGSGIDPQDLPHIFERFYRADRSRTTTTGGSGLGLAIVKAIITAHRGQVWAESIPGKWTRVLFTLPLVLPVTTVQPNQKEKRLLAGPMQRTPC
jgi:two-component system sensor histidine kinase BaeS